MNDLPAATAYSGISASLLRLAIMLAYLGGAVVAAIGAMSTISIVGRWIFSRPIAGDFELVEIGIAVAGSLFLPYCQATNGNIVVEFFTLRASEQTKSVLDRFGAFLMCVMYTVVCWRTASGTADIFRSGEVSMLMGFPIWVGYGAMLPGVALAAVAALVQVFGLTIPETASDE